MKTHVTGLAVAVLLVIGTTLPSQADDVASPAAPAASTPAEPPPASLPRPSIAPKVAEPAAPAADAEPAPRHRRYAHRHSHRWGYYRTAYWEPFPIYWPHFYRSRIHWSRIPWLFHF